MPSPYIYNRVGLAYVFCVRPPKGGRPCQGHCDKRQAGSSPIAFNKYLGPFQSVPGTFLSFQAHKLYSFNLKFFLMNEPLTNARPGMSFCGKTHNNHPQWYNQPLRLSKEQKRDPLSVMEEFFQCYHLNETRQTLWEWLTEVVSSSQSTSIGVHGRTDHMFFYEKIEELIEAAFILNNRRSKQRCKKEKRRLKMHSAGSPA